MSGHLQDVLGALGVDDFRPENGATMALSALGGDATARRENHLRYALFRLALRPIMESLGDEIPSILLKGEPLARRLYAEPAHRSTTDIDLLVLPGDHEEVRRRLMKLGYQRRAEGPRMWAYNQEALYHPTTGVVVEIHWQLAFPALPAFSLLDPLTRRRPFALADDLEVHVLPDDWMGLHLALHFHQHLGNAKGLLDLAAYCDRVTPDLDGAALLELANSLGIAGVLQWPLHAIAALTGKTPPLHDPAADATVQAWAHASAWALTGCLSRPITGGLRDSLAALSPTAHPAIVIALRSLSMLTVDGASTKGRALFRPILQGPHRVGRAVRRLHLIR